VLSAEGAPEGSLVWSGAKPQESATHAVKLVPSHNAGSLRA